MSVAFPVLCDMGDSLASSAAACVTQARRLLTQRASTLAVP
jgi:hypothetical protein